MIKLLLQLVQVFFGLASSWVRDKRAILLLSCLSSFVGVLLFFYLGRYDGVVSSFVIGLRCVVFSYKEKYKTISPFILTLVVQLVLGILSFQDLSSIIPFLVPLIVSVVFWYGDAKLIKINSLIIGVAWIIYYLCMGLYVSVLYTLFSMVLCIISLLRLNKV